MSVRSPNAALRHSVRSRLSVVLLWTVSIILTSLVTVCAADPSGQKPNVVFILADDLGWSDVSCYGQTLWETRCIDRLAREGMRFTDAYAAGSRMLADASQHLDGVSLVPLCRGAAVLDRKDLFWHHPHYSTTAVPSSAVRLGDWKLVKFYSDYQRVWKDDGKGGGRVVEARDSALLQLYNIKEDIGEQDNRASELPRKVAELHALLEEHLHRVEARLPIRNPNYDASKQETGTYKM